jgi:hypothetical protein
MSNKKETPVSWLFKEIEKDILGLEYDYSIELQTALEMESKKQQKYDEMLSMLEERFEYLDSLELNLYSQEFIEYCRLKQLIKEAKEL